jgi:N-ethylmaleimide reductase
MPWQRTKPHPAARSRSNAAAGQPLIAPTSSGTLSLEHKIVLSPLTRCRMTAGTDAPNDLVAQYYSQRSSQGGLIISECAYVSQAARGYIRWVRA